MAFHIVREISSGRKRIDGRMVDTVQAIVDFGMASPGLTTRHLEHHSVFDDKGKVTGHQWTGWNSDRMLRIREGILQSHTAHKAVVQTAETRVSDLTEELAILKAKRGVTEKRKTLREALKAAKTTLAVVKGDLEKVAAVAKKVDETHPDIVTFA